MGVDEWVEPQTIANTSRSRSTVTVWTTKTFKRVLQTLTDNVGVREQTVGLIVCQVSVPGGVAKDVPLKATRDAERIVFSLANLSAFSAKQFFSSTKADRAAKQNGSVRTECRGW